MSSRVRLKVPPPSANLGPGFDCLGLALDIYNTVTVEPAPHLSISISGEGASSLPRDEENLVFKAWKAYFSRLGERAPTASFICENRIPLRRGLGSSAAAVVAGLLAAEAFSGGSQSREELLPLAASLEGHPDNVTP